MRHEVCVIVNGEEHAAVVESRSLLGAFLREQLGLTGTHVGCDSTTCGACTVLLDGQAVKACTVLTASVTGREVLTIEGVTVDGALSPVQEGFRQCHGLQCGFCTPGMIMAATSLLLTEPAPQDGEIREAIEGNLCRCTGYQMIVESVRRAAELGGAGPAAHAHAVRGGADVVAPGASS